MAGPPPSYLPVIHKLSQNDEAAWIQIGSVAETMGDLDRAMHAYEEALRHNPHSTKALTQAAALCRTREQFSKAVDYFERVLNIDQTNGEIWGALGHCFLMQDDLQRAYTAYQQALYHLPNPKEPKLWYGIGILYDRYGSYEHAEEAFSAVIRMEPKFEKANEIYFRLGIIYKQQGKYETSLSCFKYILTCPPKPLTEVDIWFQIGHVHEQQKEYALARDAYERVLTENPNHAKVLQQLGWLYHQQNSSFSSQELAIQYLTRSLEADVNDAQTWYLLGRCYMAQQKYNKAYEAYQQAVYRDGRNPTFWCSIGVLYYQINQYRDALDAYSRAIRLNPYISEVWYDLGTLYESCNNQVNDALDAYTRALELDPSNPHIKQRLQMLRSSQGGATQNQAGGSGPAHQPAVLRDTKPQGYPNVSGPHANASGPLYQGPQPPTGFGRSAHPEGAGHAPQPADLDRREGMLPGSSTLPPYASGPGQRDERRIPSMADRPTLQSPGELVNRPGKPKGGRADKLVSPKQQNRNGSRSNVQDMPPNSSGPRLYNPQDEVSGRYGQDGRSSNGPLSGLEGRQREQGEGRGDGSSQMEALRSFGDMPRHSRDANESIRLPEIIMRPDDHGRRSSDSFLGHGDALPFPQRDQREQREHDSGHRSLEGVDRPRFSNERQREQLPRPRDFSPSHEHRDARQMESRPMDTGRGPYVEERGQRMPERSTDRRGPAQATPAGPGTDQGMEKERAQVHDADAREGKGSDAINAPSRPQSSQSQRGVNAMEIDQPPLPSPTAAQAQQAHDDRAKESDAPARRETSSGSTSKKTSAGLLKGKQDDKAGENKASPQRERPPAQKERLALPSDRSYGQQRDEESAAVSREWSRERAGEESEYPRESGRERDRDRDRAREQREREREREREKESKPEPERPAAQQNPQQPQQKAAPTPTTDDKRRSASKSTSPKTARASDGLAALANYGGEEANGGSTSPDEAASRSTSPPPQKKAFRDREESAGLKRPFRRDSVGGSSDGGSPDHKRAKSDKP
ncbi:uncharacterized protein EV422DRAFT_155897 [Fimicolochytrium jonesii]|uniref:uncharacterized protein n=1 Tax=Fimicolochytrium jonesii TaxID=1396493 RepID=UPI0022FE1E82|nr:uncharacterized protein EV422DRAFT_155897 [Fimicolochytrium jonesii]KAI8826158.1 hypothetical protein EV422DRAFT_155897 [Fimicolochytrium jonesii]